MGGVVLNNVGNLDQVGLANIFYHYKRNIGIDESSGRLINIFLFFIRSFRFEFSQVKKLFLSTFF